MNSLAAANLFDNPLVLLVIVLLSALASWLMKRQQGKQTATQPGDDEMLPSPGQQGRSGKPLDLEEAMRRLLGEELPPQPPPLPPYPSDDERPVRREQDQFQPERKWVEEPSEVDVKPRPLTNQGSARSWQERIRATAATRIQADEHLNQPDPERAKPPAIPVSTAHRRRSSVAPRVVSPWRDRRAVRQAFIASLVFALPKGLEGDSGHAA